MIQTGRVLIDQGRYVGSRNPGYLIPELGMLPLDLLGGSLATNLGTLVLGLLALWALWGIFQRLGTERPLLPLLCLAALPVFWLNATTSMDYVWAIGFVLAGWLMLLDRRWVFGGILLGLAIGSRFTSVIAVVGILGYCCWTTREKRSAILASSLALVIGIACYLPSAAEYGWTLGFLEPAGLGGQERWTWPLRIGRWAYKNIYIWGLPTAFFLVGLVPLVVRRWRHLPTPAGVLIVGLVLAYEMLFLLYPLDPGYLLPVVVFLLLGIGLALGDRTKLLGAFAFLILVSGFVSVNLARPDVPFAATDAKLGLWIQPGPLIEGARMRIRLRGCETVACWHERLGVPRETVP